MKKSRSLIGLVLIGVVTYSAFSFTRAFFSDTEASIANTMEAGDLDLKIDNTSYYNGVLSETTTWLPADLDDGEGPSTGGTYRFFDFLDIKPSDWGEDTISIHTETNDAWGCYEVTLTSNNENACTEPEQLDDVTCGDPGDGEGELADTIQFVFWKDDGDNVLETGETIIEEGTVNEVFPTLNGALADSAGGILGLNGQPMTGEETYYIGKAWCFGTLTTVPLVQNEQGPESDRTPANSSGGVSCDGSLLDNSTQTDSLTADISFSVLQARSNPGFTCDETEIVCEEEEVYASSNVLNGFSQGLRKNGTAVLAERSNPAKALGFPEGVVTPPSFVSLGFGGNIIVSFDGLVGNGPGGDLLIHEITNGRTSYPEEKAQVEVSQNLAGPWYVIGTASSKDTNGTVALDISTGAPLLTYIQYVKLTDTSVVGPFEATADGYDLDAVEGVYGACEEVEVDN